MKRQLSPNQKVDIIRAFTEQLEPMITIADRYNRSRQAIWKVLKKAGVDTSKSAATITVSCTACGKSINRTRARIRNQVNHFCNYVCYYAFLEAGNGMGPYQESRQGQRIARSKIAEVFDLQSYHIVHHEDRNCYNNMWSNLKVFANQGDHIRYHRLGPDYIQPIWDGTQYESLLYESIQ